MKSRNADHSFGSSISCSNITSNSVFRTRVPVQDQVSTVSRSGALVSLEITKLQGSPAIATDCLVSSGLGSQPRDGSPFGERKLAGIIVNARDISRSLRVLPRLISRWVCFVDKCSSTNRAGVRATS